MNRPAHHEDQRARRGSCQDSTIQRVTWRIAAAGVEGAVLAWRIECESTTTPRVGGSCASATRVHPVGGHRWLLCGTNRAAGTGVHLTVHAETSGK